ncbi:MAG: hypothetical protein WAU88_07640 [Candidatus Zixiibacteriota bacterium]
MKHLAICLTILLGVSSGFSTTIQVPSNQTTIQAGINAAVNGDTVLVAPGIYSENVRYLGKRVVVKSVAGAAGTTIQAANAAEAAVRFDQSEPKGAALIGFTVTGGGRSGIYCSGSSPTIQNNIITANMSNYINDGGGISLKNTVGSLIKGNVIYGNQAHTYGPAIHVGDNYMSSTDDTICYNIMYGNSGYWDIRSLGSVTNLHIYNNTIEVTSYGGIVAGLDTRNNIVFLAPVYGIGGGSGTQYNCAFANASNFPDPTGPGNISVDPMFVDVIAHDYRLRPGSPCINAGDPNPVFNDSDGTRNDMGALPSVPLRLPTTLHVPGEFATIQMAVDSSMDGDTILLADGIYKGSGNRDILVYRHLLITSEHGPSNTILDAMGTPADKHFVMNSTRATIRGLTFSGGWVASANPIGDTPTAGGALRAGDSTKVVNCVFTGNRADLGGAIATYTGITIESCDFRDNVALCALPYCNGAGGSIYVSGATESIVVSNCTFSMNIGESASAVAIINSSRVSFSRCSFTRNGDSPSSSLIWGVNSIISFDRTTITANNSTVFDLQFCNRVDVDKSIIAQNSGLGICYETALTLSCCDVFGNLSGDQLDCAEGQQLTGGNISANPLFCDTAAGDFRVKNTSPCLPANNSCGVQIGAFGLGCQNIAPIVSSPASINVDEESRLVYRGTVTDPDGPGVNWAYLNKPSWLTSNADSIFGTPHYENHDTSFTVIASDGFLSDTQIVTVTVLPQTPEVPLARVDGDTLNLHVVSLAPQINWHYFDPTGTSPQTEFEIAVGTDNEWTYSEMWNPAPFVSSDSFVNYGGLALIKGHTYYLRLRAYNGSRWSPYKYGNFRLNSKPSIPLAKYPINNQVVGSTPTLWIQNAVDPENDASVYDFQGFHDTDCVGGAGITLTNVPGGADSTGGQITTALAENCHYWWQVRSFDGYEYSDWSSLAQFRVNGTPEPPNAFSLMNPQAPDNKPVYSLLPTLQWNQATDPDPGDTVRYRVELSLSAGFGLPFIKDSLLATQFQVPDSLQFGTHYWWRVTAKDKTGLATPSITTNNFWTFQLGDINGSHACDLADLSTLVVHLTGGGLTISPRMAGDLNGDCRIDLADLSRLVSYLTGGGAVIVVGC